MLTARIALGLGCFVALLTACVGGPGTLPNSGPDQSTQGGGITTDPSGSGTSQDETQNGGTTDAPPKQAVSVRAADFDQSCALDADCVAIFEGSTCSTCLCANAAIAKKDQTNYSTRFATGRAACGAVSTVSCAPCATQTAGCNPSTKKCALGVTSGGPDAG